MSNSSTKVAARAVSIRIPSILPRLRNEYALAIFLVLVLKKRYNTPRKTVP
jgi:hypothetical protein